MRPIAIRVTKPAPFSSFFGVNGPFRFACETNGFVLPFGNALKS